MSLGQAAGRPLRFAGLVLTGWVSLRVLVLWSQTGNLPDAIRQGVPGGTMVERLVAQTDLMAALPGPAAAQAALPRAVPLAPAPQIAPRLLAPASNPVPGLLAIHTPAHVAEPDRIRMASAAIALIDPIHLVAPESSPRLMPDAGALGPRPGGLSGSAWLVARGGSGSTVAGQGQLGGAQAGARLRYPVAGPALTAMAGVNLPLATTGRELVTGIEWRPVRAPITLIAERRDAIDGVAGTAVGAGAVMGMGPSPVGGGVSVELYGQGGALVRDRIQPYADGAARALRPVGGGISLGGGVWGGAQRDAARLDIGPSAVATVRLGPQPVRIALDWRQRVAGDAAPDSGPALTVGLDF
ncbi:hypothetical protein ACNI3Q_12840 [Sphingomonas sp. FW199]|uniref:hypothetical protein n=1 Tax=Sphingomonas sp. FW199 TaxID=3400217 RepID=UPI003CE9D349